MTDNTLGGFSLSDDNELLRESIGSPLPAGTPAVSPIAAAPTQASDGSESPAFVPGSEGVAPPSAGVAPAPASSAPPVSAPRKATREERLGAALDGLMENDRQIVATALVSLDGFTMASALPDNMRDDRIGAMSAAILGLGERASAELGRGAVTQVFIEGDTGYVILVAAGERAALTCITGTGAKLGLVLYDMRETAESIAEILG